MISIEGVSLCPICKGTGVVKDYTKLLDGTGVSGHNILLCPGCKGLKIITLKKYEYDTENNSITKYNYIKSNAKGGV